MTTPTPKRGCCPVCGARLRRDGDGNRYCRKEFADVRHNQAARREATS